MQMRKSFGQVLLLTVFGLGLVPAVASAQSAIAGVVKDTTGAVMPGVTVEAASPVLIEKVRSVVSDSQGQYKIVDLRPGVYSVTFMLPGFNTVKRDAIELPSNFTATINADLRVGGVEETITVSGQSPVVDVQNAVQQTVLTRQVLPSRFRRRGPSDGRGFPDRAQHSHAWCAPVGRPPGSPRRRRHLRHAEPRSHGPRVRRPGHDVPSGRHDPQRDRG